MTTLHPTRKLDDGTYVADLGDICDQIKLREDMAKCGGNTTVEMLPVLFKILSQEWKMKLPTAAHIDKVITMLNQAKETLKQNETKES